MGRDDVRPGSVLATTPSAAPLAGAIDVDPLRYEAPMPQVIQVRDIARGRTHEFGPDVPVLRGPYELFKPDGPVRRNGAIVEWTAGGTPKVGRVVEASMALVHPGERVLVCLSPPEGESSESSDWWLCEVEAVDGVRGMP
jgi:hypothetical protein